MITDLNLQIQAGEFVALVGPSGCGKSTLIRIIAGLEVADTGSLLLDGRDITRLEPKDRELSMVFQNYALYPHKTVFENIAFPLMILNHTKSKISATVEDIAHRLNIADLLQRKPGQLSGGQRQRVALARALAKKPKIFLLDEPLSNLDAKLRTQMRQELFRLHKDLDSIFIYVTHDQVEAMTLGDRVVILNEGAIQQIGTPAEVYNSPANVFVASFIGNPATNILRSCEGAQQLGLRPEFLSLDTSKDSELDLEVHNLEILGSEVLLYGSILEPNKIFASGQNLVAKLSNDKFLEELNKRLRLQKSRNTQSSEKIKLYFDRNLLYCF